MTRYSEPEPGEWIWPKPVGYKLACCDCGLVHRYDFRIVDRHVEFRVWPAHRETGQMRRHMKPAADPLRAATPAPPEPGGWVTRDGRPVPPGPWRRQTGLVPDEDEHGVYLVNDAGDSLILNADDVAELANARLAPAPPEPDLDVERLARQYDRFAGFIYGVAETEVRVYDGARPDASMTLARLVEEAQRLLAANPHIEATTIMAGSRWHRTVGGHDE